jgi:catechol 2,3-dioxygenase-like lactoylglutathione lyase family enzyme
MKLDHTRLLVLNFPACFRFYRDTLHLKPSWGDENDIYASFTQGDDPTPVLSIFRRDGMSEVLGTATLPLNPASQDRCMLIVEVEDLDATIEEMRQHGIKFVKGATVFPDWGYRGAFLRDPDGHLIELSAPLPMDQWSEGLQQAAEKWED